MQDLDLGTLRIRSAPLVKTDHGIKPLLEARNQGLIYAYEKEGLRAILINFDLKQSDLPFRVAFPVLMTNCFRWLKPLARGRITKHIGACAHSQMNSDL